MNLIEAIKSGMPFRRKSLASDWYGINKDKIVYQPQFGDQSREATWRIEDILAEDWEIHEPTVTITRTQFMEAFGQSYTDRRFEYKTVDTALATILARNLGLENP